MASEDGALLRELDKLVLNYAYFENLLFPASNLLDNVEQPHSVRFKIRCIRKLLKMGHVHSAMQYISEIYPGLLQHQRLLFFLYKQKFIELLRSEKADSLPRALDCARSLLAPCALHAYPEAYGEFKHCMLTLLYAHNEKDSPVSEEWSELKRTELAGAVSSTLTAILKSYDSNLSLILRYLINIHTRLCYRNNVDSPHKEFIDKLINFQKDLPCLSLDCDTETLNFNELDVQNLAQAVEVPRQTALNSLKYTKGDLFLAFKNELSRIPFNESALDELIKEYCIYRGLLTVKNSFSMHKEKSNSGKRSESKIGCHFEFSNVNGNILKQDIKNDDDSDDDDDNKNSNDSSETDFDECDVSSSFEMDVDFDESFIGFENSKLNTEGKVKHEMNSLQSFDVSDCETDIVVDLNENSLINNRGGHANDSAFAENGKSILNKNNDFYNHETPLNNVSHLLLNDKQLNDDNANGDNSIKFTQKRLKYFDSEANSIDESVQNNSNKRGCECIVEKSFVKLNEDIRSENERNCILSSNVKYRWKGRFNVIKSDFADIDYDYDEFTSPINDAEFKIDEDAQRNYVNGSFFVNDLELLESYERHVYKINRLLKKGDIHRLIETINRIDAEFFDLHPNLHFLLKQVEFSEEMKKKDVEKALQIAKCDLGTMATKHPSLFPSLKTTLFVLANPEDDVTLNLPPINEIAHSIQVALFKQMGLKEPKLVEFMRTLLASHSEWLKINMCSDDDLACQLNIHLLKSPGSKTTAPNSNLDPNSDYKGINGSLQLFESSINNNNNNNNNNNAIPSRNDAHRNTTVVVVNGEDEPRGEARSQFMNNSSPLASSLSDTSILHIMEVMEISRGDAIELLMQFNGNMDNLFAIVYG